MTMKPIAVTTPRFAQIREKKYAEPYRTDKRPVRLVGLNFDRETRQLDDCVAEIQEWAV